MTDREITEALWRRDEAGLAAVMELCGGRCRKIAGNILPDSDAEEVVADTWLKIWQSIPPNRPESIAAYACRITRNLAINRYYHNKAARRRPEALTDWMELTENPDLFETVQAADPTAESAEAAETAAAIDRFLRTLPVEDRVLFVRRFVYLEDTDALAQRLHLTKGHIHVKLHRLRKKLRQMLEEEKLL
ncbi:MAG: sigma-70 family RNA polymerase sigma factor [Ruminococcaceae bacterium]|nr:sigma-70 family RNA polymerase sigma factor [Oscillospiraceae bacterium]